MFTNETGETQTLSGQVLPDKNKTVSLHPGVLINHDSKRAKALRPLAHVPVSTRFTGRKGRGSSVSRDPGEREETSTQLPHFDPPGPERPEGGEAGDSSNNNKPWATSQAELILEAARRKAEKQADLLLEAARQEAATIIARSESRLHRGWRRRLVVQLCIIVVVAACLPYLALRQPSALVTLVLTAALTCLNLTLLVWTAVQLLSGPKKP